MRDTVDCGWFERQLPAYLRSELTSGERERIRGHLADCAACREILGDCFLLDRWEEGGLPPGETPGDFTPRIMAKLLQNEDNGRTCSRAPGAGLAARSRLLTAQIRASGRRVLWNYLAAAAVTMVLMFTNVFWVVIDRASRADRLNQGARAITLGTQRLLERRPHWPDIWPGPKSKAR